MAATPTQRPSSTSRSSANHRSQQATAVSRTSSTSARSISAPVAAPPAWTMRGREWPPSRASCSRPSRSRSNMAPMAMSSLTRLGPSSTSARTASTSHRSAPAPSVSARWRSVESGSPASTAATPPCAQRVAACDSSDFVSTPTRSASSSAARTAADSPATPLPRTSRSSSSAPSQVMGPPGQASAGPARPGRRAARPRGGRSCRSQPSGTRSGATCAQRRQHEGPLVHAGVGHDEVGLVDRARRRSTARRRPACAAPSGRPACGWPSPPGGGTARAARGRPGRSRGGPPCSGTGPARRGRRPGRSRRPGDTSTRSGSSATASCR